MIDYDPWNRNKFEDKNEKKKKKLSHLVQVKNIRYELFWVVSMLNKLINYYYPQNLHKNYCYSINMEVGQRGSNQKTIFTQ